MNRFFLLFCLLCLFCSEVSGQNIKGHYVARAQDDGMLYHTLPTALFEHRTFGDLTFDLTYKQGSKTATLNFTYLATEPTPTDSVAFVCGATILSGATQQIYIEPAQKQWKHRYTCSVPADQLGPFFQVQESPQATLYFKGTPYLYSVKRSAWNSYAPIGHKIFEMIKLNEKK